MKNLSLLVSLLILVGCERRTPDTEIEAVRVWLQSETGQAELSAPSPYYFDDSKFLPKSFVPGKSWEIKRAIDDYMPSPGPSVFFIFAEEEKGGIGWAFTHRLNSDKLGAFIKMSRKDFNGLGDPVSLKAVSELFPPW